MALSGRGRPYLHREDPQTYASILKGQDDLYPFSALDFKPNDVKNTRDGILGPLSIFAPVTLEEENLEIFQEEAERPTTPINDEIKGAPSTFNGLAKHIRRRISARSDLPHMSEDDQKELAGIIIGELTVKWPHLRSPVDHPLLSEEENKELQRRMTVEIVLGCERLFHEHVNKLQVLNKRGIFSGTANMTRLKAQLGLNTRNLLNLSSLKRKIMDELKLAKKIEDAAKKSEHSKGISFRNVGETAQIVKAMRLDKYQNTQSYEIEELISKMPTLDTSDLHDILANLSAIQPQFIEQEDASSSSPPPQQSIDQDDKRSEKDVTIPIKQRAMSMPRIGPKEKLLEELKHRQLEKPTERRKPQSATDDKLNINTSKYSEKTKEEKVLTPREDLARLMERNEDQFDLLEEKDLEDDDADLPPLIRALPRNAKHDGKHAEIMKQLKELEERENARIEAETIDIEEPKYIQPETTTTKIPNKMTVKTSDIRVSDRVCLSSITVQGHETVYNDLIDEISAEDGKKLDSNLFLGDEIKEVYAEIMKTVPTDHLRLEQDDMIEPAADSINLSKTLASSTLRGRKQDRVINPDLQHDTEPPWGEHSVTTWANMPEHLGRTDTAGNGELSQPPTAPNGEEAPAQDFMARTYASWLMWWKNTINSDDYMKYLSTQETDYLGVIFHFYDTEGEEEEEDDDDSKQRQASRLQRQIEREEKLTQLRAQKETYETGYWNANSVLLGGLGKDPLLVEEGLEDEKSQTNTTSTAPLKTARNGTTVLPLSQLHAQMQTAEAGRISVRNTEPDTPRGTQSGTQSVGSRGVSRNTTKSKQALGPSPQDRLDEVWMALQMPDNLRLDMAIKYSSDAYFNKLDAAIVAWETITELITNREKVLADLESFERTASDPNRFFEKGPRGSSVARLDEAKMRSNLYKKIDSLDEKILGMIKGLQEEFMDEITFKGRPYAEKMKWDRVEMLYWLQEERKQAILDMKPQQSSLPMAQLEPIVRPPSVMSH